MGYSRCSSRNRRQTTQKAQESRRKRDIGTAMNGHTSTVFPFVSSTFLPSLFMILEKSINNRLVRSLNRTAAASSKALRFIMSRGCERSSLNILPGILYQVMANTHVFPMRTAKGTAHLRITQRHDKATKQAIRRRRPTKRRERWTAIASHTSPGGLCSAFNILI